MRLFLILLAISIYPNQDEKNSTKHFEGIWDICYNSHIGDLPKFQQCDYKIVVDNTGKLQIYNILKNQLEATGIATLTFHSELNKKKLFKLNITFFSINNFKLTDYIPSKSIILLSNKKIIFLTEDTLNLESAYYLKKYEK